MLFTAMWRSKVTVGVAHDVLPRIVIRRGPPAKEGLPDADRRGWRRNVSVLPSMPRTLRTLPARTDQDRLVTRS